MKYILKAHEETDPFYVKTGLVIYYTIYKRKNMFDFEQYVASGHTYKGLKEDLIKRIAMDEKVVLAEFKSLESLIKFLDKQIENENK